MKNMIIAGIDLGTAAIKVVFINEKHELLWMKAVPTMPESVAGAKRLLDEGLAALSIARDQLSGIAATGYGKRILDYTDMTVDEITALCVGTHNLSQGRARTVINIGGQDTKAVKINASGKIDDFKMNEKCAAGTGRFLEMVSRVLAIPVQQLGDFDTLGEPTIIINNTCTVFAESEIVSLLYKNIDKKNIITAIHRSIARRISEFISNLRVDEDVYLDGGSASNNGLVFALKEELARGINTFAHPQFTSAIGAAMALLKK